MTFGDDWSNLDRNSDAVVHVSRDSHDGGHDWRK
jgi:hypothetical protein